ncbi:MAG: trypsin-like peptidase domain-containing protein [Dehalococcoidia bacterium]|nr:trypsin-like peptidase domain-containing protein [Dehalococcoidia bacterium]
MKLYTFITILSLFFVSCDNDQWDTPEESDLVIQENKPLEDSENKYKDIYIKSTKSVVQIDLYSRDLSGIPDNKIGTGSGFLWDNNGNILTNYHVIQPAVSNNNPIIVVRTINNDEYLANIVGLDSSADLAIIKIYNPNNDEKINALSPLELYDSDLISPGDLTIAIGSPFDQEFTMTTGIVSAIGRSLDSTFTPYKIPSVIQTDAAINPGNSGGPLLNKDGKVIGINTQIKSSSRQNSGVGFAVPINLAKRVVKSIINGKDHKYSYLGITALNLDFGTRIRADIEENFKGILILNVLSNGPADKSGILGDSSSSMSSINYDGDIITKIDNFKINTFEDLISYLALNTEPGDIVKIEVVRDYKYLNLEVNLEARPD